MQRHFSKAIFIRKPASVVSVPNSSQTPTQTKPKELTPNTTTQRLGKLVLWNSACGDSVRSSVLWQASMEKSPKTSMIY